MAYLDDLVTARNNAAAELARMDADQAGGLPNTMGGAGTHVDHMGYRRLLLEQIRELDKMIAEARSSGDGNAFEVTSQGYAG